MDRVNYIPVFLAACAGGAIGMLLSAPTFASLSAFLESRRGPIPYYTTLPSELTATTPRNTGRIAGTLEAIDTASSTLLLQTEKGTLRFSYDPNTLTFTKITAQMDEHGIMVDRTRSDALLAELTEPVPQDATVMVYYPFREDGRLVAHVISY